ncbi:MAG TPA: hypothetical protein VGP31_17135 [Planosporangium sp.]|jgi:hypothetical protein|nr:hypothetical protein [Planosporangium sp.]
MRTRGLRRRCARLVDTLDIPVPFSAHELCARFATQRGRAIELMALSMPAGGPCGVWVAAKDRDFIFFERGTSPLHQEHIILHEFAHLFCGHTTTSVLAPETSRLLLPNLDPTVVGRVLQRTHYSAEEEREAETAASLVLERANRWRPASEWAAPPESAGIRQRIGRALEHPTGEG